MNFVTSECKKPIGNDNQVRASAVDWCAEDHVDGTGRRAHGDALEEVLTDGVFRDLFLLRIIIFFHRLVVRQVLHDPTHDASCVAPSHSCPRSSISGTQSLRFSEPPRQCYQAPQIRRCRADRLLRRRGRTDAANDIRPLPTSAVAASAYTNQSSRPQRSPT